LNHRPWQPVDPDDLIAKIRNTETTEFRGDRGGHDAGTSEVSEVLSWEVAIAIVHPGT
jgi:hypothetical protein